MKTLQRAASNEWYIYDKDHTTVAHTTPYSLKINLLSLANVEEKIREWDAELIKIIAPYKDGRTWLAFIKGVQWAKTHYKVTLPDTYEVEVTIQGDFMVVTKIVRAV